MNHLSGFCRAICCDIRQHAWYAESCPALLMLHCSARATARGNAGQDGCLETQAVPGTCRVINLVLNQRKGFCHSILSTGSRAGSEESGVEKHARMWKQSWKTFLYKTARSLVTRCTGSCLLTTVFREFLILVKEGGVRSCTNQTCITISTKNSPYLSQGSHRVPTQQKTWNERGKLNACWKEVQKHPLETL